MELKLQNWDLPAIVDSEDFDRLNQYKWYVKGDYKGGIYRYVIGSNASEFISLTSEIMSQPKQMFDHRDRNWLNNSKSNLRPCTYSQNMMNRCKNHGSKSKYKGVHWMRSRGKWRARIKFQGKEYHIGVFHNAEAAALAYNRKALELFGEFACLNDVKLT